MPKYKQVTLGELTLKDIDKTIIVLDGGNSFVGNLDEIHLYGTGKYKTTPTASIKARALGGANGELSLANLPLDFVIQIVDEIERFEIVDAEVVDPF